MSSNYVAYELTDTVDGAEYLALGTEIFSNGDVRCTVLWLFDLTCQVYWPVDIRDLGAFVTTR